MAATLHYIGEGINPRTYLGPYKPYFCKVNERRPMKIYFSRLHISPGGYPVMDILEKNTEEHYRGWFRMFEYRMHPKGTFEFEDEEIEQILRGGSEV